MRFLFPPDIARGRPLPGTFLEYVRTLPPDSALRIELVHVANRQAIIVSAETRAASAIDLPNRFVPAGMTAVEISAEITHRTGALLEGAVASPLSVLRARRLSSIPTSLDRPADGPDRHRDRPGRTMNE